MIKKLLLFCLAILMNWAIQAQISDTIVVYTNGHQEVERLFGVADTSIESACVDTLTINIPAGNYVYSVDVNYDIQTFGQVWRSDLQTYVEFASGNTKEGAVYSGTQNAPGTESFSRNGLLFATGTSATGELKFVLHAFRTFGQFNPICDTTNARVIDSTFEVTVHYGPTPTCFPPTNPEVNWIMSNKAEVSWTTGGATNWQIEYGSAGFTQGNGTLINATTNPFVITGLSANTSYDFYVRDSCGAADVSTWSPLATFTTICAPLSAPYTQDFDGASWDEGAGFQNAGDSIDVCWERSPDNGGGYFWGTGSGTTPTANTGPSADNTTGSNNYVYTEASLGVYQSIATISSPLIDLNALTVPEVEFYYHMYGLYCGQLFVEVWNQQNGWQTVFTISGEQQDSSGQAWIKENVTLSNYADDTVRIRLRTIRSFQAEGDIAIDDIKLKEAPTCPKPSNLTLTNVGTNFVTLSWTAAGATSWDIQHGLTGFGLGNGTITNVSTNPAPITGLTPGATYDFYVREHCSSTDTSDWIGPLTATVLCNPISAPYFEDFDSTTWVPGIGTYNFGDTLADCWIRAPGAGTSATSSYFWGAREDNPTTPGTGPDTDKSGTGNFIYTEGSSGTPGQNAAISVPNLDLSALTTPELRFWYHMYGSGMGILYVDIISQKTGINLAVYSIIGQQQNSPTAVWSEAIVNLSSFANDTVVIVFRGVRGTSNLSDIAIDEVAVDEAPTCPDPAALVASNITSNSVDLSWVTGGASNWNIVYGTPGFTPAATFNTTASNPYTLTGLTPATSYDIYVRDSCAAGDVSNWVGPISIFTLCGPIAAPYTENFDTTYWVEGGNQTPGQIDLCWVRSDTTTYWWKAGTGATPSNNTGPITDHTTGTGNYIFTETNNGGTSTTISTPLLDLTALTTPELTFYYHMYGANISKLEVEVNNGSGWSVESAITGQQHSSSNASWTQQLVDLSAYANDTIQIRFKGTRTNGFLNQVDMAVDDIDVHEQPTCPQPSNLVTTASTASSVTLSWTTGGATAWQIEYGPVGFTPGAGTIVAAPTNPYTITGLSGSTTYDFYVRDDCGSGDTSLWVGPATDNTLCTVASAPFTENFDFGFDEGTGNANTGSTIGACWTRTPATGYHWGGGTGTTPTGGTGPTTDHTSGIGNYAYTEASSGGGGGGGNPPTAELESPSIEFSSLTNPMLYFWYHMNGAGIGSFDVEVYDGSTWTTELTLSASQGNAWLDAQIALSGYVGDTIKVRFTSTRGTGFQAIQGDIAIDDFVVDEAPSCPKPQNFVVNSTSSNSVTLSWTTGGSTIWNIEYGTPGFAPGSGTYVTATTNPFTVNGLSANTTYEFYIRDSCGVGDVSPWVGPISVTTECGVVIAPYSENFDGPSWIPGAGGFAAGTIDSCWTRSAAIQYWWKPGQGATASPQTGPSGDHTSGSGKYVYTESQFGGSTNTSLSSPLIDLDTLSNPELRYWYHMYGTMINDLTVEINDGSGWSPIDTITAPQQTSQTASWIESTVDLSSYAGDTIQLRFIGDKDPGNQNRADISIDDISIDNAPTCLKPSNLAATAATTTSITLSWTTGGSANWQIEYGPVGFTPGSGTIVNATTNPFAVTGLSPAQSYDFYVRDSCGAGETSFWEGPITENTSCGTVVAPYFENFDSGFDEGIGTLNDGSTISPCWTRNPDSAYHWGGGTAGTGTFGTGPNGDHTSGFGNYVYAEASLTPNGSEATLETPSINTSGLTTTPELRFWYHMYALNGTQGSLIYEVFSNNTWTVIDSIVGNQGNVWLEKVVNLNAYANQTIKIRFRARKGNGPTPQQGDIAIDDLSIVNAPACPDPTGLTASVLTNTSIQLAWTSISGNSQIEYGPTGFTPGSGTLISASTNPLTVTGLTQGMCYDFYVRDSCGASTYSNWIGPVNACTYNCINGCTYELKLTDTFGDGWIANGQGTLFHTLDVTIGTSTATYTFSNGYDTTITLNVCDLDTIIMNFIDGGQWNNECGVELKNSSGIVVHTSAGYTGSMMVYAGSASCTNPCPPPVASFSQNATGLTVNFDASASTGNTLSYAWTYGDGNSGSGGSPSHTYAQDGTYTITLVVTDLCGQTDTTTTTVTVCAPLFANFSWSQSGLDLTVDGTIVTNAISWNWNFGDGSTDTGSVVTHSYAGTGTYNVSLSVSNICGQTADTSFIITICVEPIANWSYTILSSGSNGMTVQFDGSGSFAATNFFWDFGDGNTNNVSAIPVHTYSVPGLFYVVTLIVTNNCGDDDTLKVSLAQVGIDENEMSELNLYPNPASTEVNILIPPSIVNNPVAIAIYDITGKIINSFNFEKAEEMIRINLESISQGTYLIHLESGETILRKRLIISH